MKVIEYSEAVNPPTIKKRIIDSHEVCSKCRGYCCYRFNITIPERHEEDIGKYADAVCSKKDSKFIRNNFVEVEHIPQIGPMFPVGTDKTFTCKSYDVQNGKCLSYSNRPYLCRIYQCDCVRTNGDPEKDGSWNRIQREILEKNGL